MAGVKKIAPKGSLYMLDALFRGQSVPSALYVGLSKVAITDATTLADINPTNEPLTTGAGTPYGRQQIAASQMSAAEVTATGAQIQNGGANPAVEFNFNTDSHAQHIVAVFVCTVETGYTGDIISYCNLDQEKISNAGEALTIGQDYFTVAIN